MRMDRARRIATAMCRCRKVSDGHVSHAPSQPRVGISLTLSVRLWQERPGCAGSTGQEQATWANAHFFSEHGFIAAALSAFGTDLTTWNTILSQVLPQYARTTAIMATSVALFAAIIGTATAWAVTVYRFPFSRLLEVLLVLPLAFPAYVLAYAYTAMLDHPGPVQTLLREMTGWGPRDYWFPNVRSLGGAIAMLTFVLYPYVYLLARASFRQQSATTYLAARSLGQTPLRAFLRVSLPMARPAIAGGTLLVIMESIADYGTVAHFNVQTFSTGIYQAWFSVGDRGAASQLALVLLVVALVLAWLERAQRARLRTAGRGGRFEAMDPVRLRGGAGWAATLICALPVLVGFALPLLMLGSMAIESGQSILHPRYRGFFVNSITVAGIAAGITVLGAIIISYRARTQPTALSRQITSLAGIGYAVPGGVIAVGLMVPFAAFDNWLDALMRETFDLSTGLLITGSIWLLIVAYLVRFMAAALNAYDSGLATVPLHYDAVARSLGKTGPGVMARVHLPAARTSVLTAGLIVFVDVMKELPATLILHPEAAVPSLALVAVGFVPVVILIRTIGRQHG